MADRSVVTRFEARVDGYLRGVTQMSAATDKFATRATTNAAKHQKAVEGAGKAAALSAVAIAAAIGLAVKAYASFDKQMSEVKAVSGATAKEMTSLKAAALEAGAATKFSATDAAKAEAELAKVGLSASQIVGGALKGSLDLAAAGNLDLGHAAEIAGQAMKIFKLEGKDVPRVADVLASGANKSAASVDDLAMALSQGGQVAAQTGLSLEDTVGTLSLFADNALKGSDAGTSMKTMLQRFTPQSDQAAASMKALGLDFYDAQGNFIGIEAVAGQLKDRLKNLSVEQRQAALSTIFGSDAIRAASILYDQGAVGVRTYVRAVNDQGAAARQSAVMMNNLSGDLETLRGSVETALIQSGSAGNAVLRELTQSATSVVNGFAGLPEEVQAVGLGFAALSASGLLAGGAFLTIVPKIAETQKALIALRETTALSKVSLASIGSVLTGPWGLALAAGSIALGAFAKSHLDAKRKTDDLTNSLDQETGAITDNTRAIVAKRLQDEGAFETARRSGIALQTVTDAALGNVGALQILQDAQKKAVVSQFLLSTGSQDFTKASSGSADATLAQANSLTGLLQSVLPINDALGGQAAKQAEIKEAMGGATGAVQGLSQAEYAAAQSAGEMQKAQDDLVASIKAGNKELFSARDATRGYYAAVDAAKAALKENGKTLDIHTEKGRKNQQALDDIAQAALAMAVENFAAGKSIGSVTKQVDTARAQFIEMAVKMNMSRGAANKLADQMGLTRDRVAELNGAVEKLPDGKTVSIKVLGVDPAVDGIGRIRTAVTNLQNGKTVTITTRYVTEGRLPNGGTNTQGGITQADGGYITGPGSKTSDSIPAWLSNGEFVVKASAVDKYGTGILHAINDMRFADGGLVGRAPRYADGGQVDFSAIMALVGDVTDWESVLKARSNSTSKAAAITAAKNALASLVAQQRKAARDLAAARRSGDRNSVLDILDRQRLLLGKVAAAEGKLAAARYASAAAAKSTAAIEKEYAADRAPLINRADRAAKTSNAVTAAFLRNISTLQNRGYGALALQLMDMGGPEAEQLAADAVRWPSAAANLAKSFAESASLQAKLEAMKAAAAGQLPALVAPGYDYSQVRDLSGVIRTGSGGGGSTTINNEIHIDGVLTDPAGAGFAIEKALVSHQNQRGSTLEFMR